MAENIAEKLFSETPEAPAETPAPVQEPVVETPPVVEPPTPEPPKQEAPKPEPGFVPIAAVLDEREKRKDAEKRLAALEADRQQQAPPVPADPEQLAAYIQQQTSQAILSARFDDSEERAVEKHGADAVAAAKEWGLQRASESPAFAAEYVRQKHPFDWAVRQHKKEQLVSELGDDEAAQRAFIERRARELGLIPASPPPSASAPAAPQPVAQPQPKPAAPTPSLASAPSAGGPMTPVAPQNAVVERLFGKT